MKINPYLRLLPFLLIYIGIIYFYSGDELIADAVRYHAYAENIVQGYYTPKEAPRLGNGPGYPILLAPFVAMNAPLVLMRIPNAFFLYFGLVYFFYTLRLFMKGKSAWIFTLLLAFYIPFLRYINWMITELISYFLIFALIFHFCKFIQRKKILSPHFFISGIICAYLAMVKVCFGNVMLANLIILSIVFIFKRHVVIKKTIFVYLLGFSLCIPYLLYTHSLTGKHLYWIDCAGKDLYCMSSLHPKDLGNYFSAKDMDANPERKEYHSDYYKAMTSDKMIERDKLLMDIAIKNIKTKPTKYLKNWVANICRLLFNYPYSYTYQAMRSYFYFIPNMFLVVLFAISLLASKFFRILVPVEMRILSIFFLVYFLGSTLVTGETRYFLLNVPLISLFTSFIINKLVIAIKKHE